MLGWCWDGAGLVLGQRKRNRKEQRKEDEGGVCQEGAEGLELSETLAPFLSGRDGGDKSKYSGLAPYIPLQKPSVCKHTTQSELFLSGLKSVISGWSTSPLSAPGAVVSIGMVMHSPPPPAYGNSTPPTRQKGCLVKQVISGL